MARPWRRRQRPQAGSVIEVTGSLAAAALGTPVPLGSMAKLVSELAISQPDAAARWDERFVATVGRWIDAHPTLVDKIGNGAFEGWETRLIKEFADAGAESFMGSDRKAREQAVDVISRAVFLPPTKFGWDASRAAAQALLDDLPELLVQAAGDNAEFLALRSILSRELAEVLAAVDRLSDRLPAPTAHEVALETYLTALCEVLDVDQWARAIGTPAQSLEAGFQTRTVRHYERPEWLSLHEVADACGRLVILGDPGSGKSWVARHLAIRAAERAGSLLEAGAAELLEVPLFARASAVLDAPDDLSPWDAMTWAAIGRVGEYVGRDGARSLADRLDRHGGHYLVILDGLDETLGRADTERLDRLARTPGRELRVILTSRPGAWRLQLPLDETRSPFKPGAERPSHAVVELEPLSDQQVNETVARLLAKDPSSRAVLMARLGTEAQLATLARTPLACVMLCAAVLLTGEVPRGRTRLFAAVITLLLRSTWRQSDPSDQVLDEARRTLQRVADDAAADDPVSGLGRWRDTVALPSARSVSAEALACIDAAAPVVAFEPLAATQPRRFIHESVRAHLLAERIARLAVPEAADRLRDHLWFDVDWAEALPAALALHPGHDALLASLLDTRQAPHWEDVLRLDGFGELRGLLRALARETDADAWNESCRRLITTAAHEALAAEPTSAMRLEFVRGGWPDDRARQEHLAAVVGGNPFWPDRDIAEGIASLRLTASERHEAAAALLERIAAEGGYQLQRAARTFDLVCADDLEAERGKAVDRLVHRLESEPADAHLDALMTIGASEPQRRRAAAVVIAWLESREPGPLSVWEVPGLLSGVRRLRDDPEMFDRPALRQKVLELLTATTEPTELEALSDALEVLRRDPATCAAAIRHVLESMGGTDSYDTDRLRRLVGELIPGDPEIAATVLSLLLAWPASEWSRWDMVLAGIDRLVGAADGQAVEATTTSLVERLETDDLADLHRLAEVIGRLDPAAAVREDATTVLLDRLRRTDAEVILSCAIALRELDPPPDVRRAAAQVIHARLESVLDPLLRVALAGGVLWFADDGDLRADAIRSIIEQVPSNMLPVLWEVQRWAITEHATHEERALAFEAFLDLLRTTRQPLIAADLAKLADHADQRARAVDVLLDRLRQEPGRHPYDWLLPAADLDAPAERLAEANACVVDALPRMELTGGETTALAHMWERVPLTPDQRAKAAESLVVWLEHGAAGYTQDVCKLFVGMQPSTELRAAAAAKLRRRLDGDTPTRRYFLVHALETLEPGFVDPYEQSTVITGLRSAFSIEQAERLLRLGVDEPTRREVVRLLVAHAAENDVPGYQLERLERLADEFGLTRHDLRTATDGEPLRRLARSARRRCTGDEWRGFLVEAGMPPQD